MGKLTTKQADKLVEAKLMTKKQVDKLQNAGAISKRQRNGAQYTMKTADSKNVYPQLYYKGLSGGKYSKKMTEFRSEFNKLLAKYATKQENK